MRQQSGLDGSNIIIGQQQACTYININTYIKDTRPVIISLYTQTSRLLKVMLAPLGCKYPGHISGDKNFVSRAQTYLYILVVEVCLTSFLGVEAI